MNYAFPNSRQSGLWMVVALAAVMLLPWLGLTHYNTKGEPREAVVAQAMMRDGNGVLPLTYGEDIPYKPPMLAWTIVAASQLTGGHVTHYSSRLPSALAAIILAAMTYMWVTRRRQGCPPVPPATGLLTAMVLLTAFEVLRAATVCRVDMLLTMFMVGSIYLLDNEGVKDRKPWRYVGAILMMSGAVMTKGPIGAFLPCLVAGVYRLWIGRPLWRTLGIMAGVGAASLLLPAVWYVAAWHQGGSHFLTLAWEENIGRLTGTMSYDSHLNPWWYNIVTLLSGMLPYTLFVLLAVWSLRGRPAMVTPTKARIPFEIGRMAWVGALIVFVFYCIPASKRSVYLLPMYPFMAWGVVVLARRCRPWCTSVYMWVLYVVAVLVPIGALVLSMWTPIKKVPLLDLGIAQWMLVALPAAVAVYRLAARKGASLPASVSVTVLLYIAMLGALQPAVLNGRSNMGHAAQVARIVPKGVIYSYSGKPLDRYYSLDFYLDGRMRRLETGARQALPQQFYLLANRRCLDSVNSLCPGRAIEATRLSFPSADTRRDTLTLYKVNARTAH